MNEKREIILESSAKALIALIPGIGGAVGSVIADCIQSRHEERLRAFVDALYLGLSERVEKLDREKISTEGFQDIFENSIREAVRNRHLLKREALKNILLNTMTEFDVSLDESEYIIGFVTQLPIKHLHLLHELSNKVIVKDKESENSERILNELGLAIGADLDTTFDILTDLEHQNLSLGLASHFQTRGGRGGMFVSELDSYLTSKGKRLIQLVNNQVPLK